MKKSELKQLIREVVEEYNGVGMPGLSPDLIAGSMASAMAAMGKNINDPTVKDQIKKMAAAYMKNPTGLPE